MAAHVCPHCQKEYTNKKELRACIFNHLAEEETQPEVLEATPLEEVETIEEEAVDEVDEEPESLEYFMTEPLVVQAGKNKDGDWIIYNGMGERSLISAEHFEQLYSRCDGEFIPVVLPRRICPEEMQYLATNSVIMVRVEGLLTEDYDIHVHKVDFVRR